MRADKAPDHASLALLAQRDAAAELRPLLLRVQVQSFASAHRRGAAMVESFETIALGLIPLVPDDAVAEAALILRDVEDVPPSVVAALAERKSRDGETRRGTGEPIDLAVATTDDTIDQRSLDELVDEAAMRPDLAALLLARSELTVFDRAALYRHADASSREAIRIDLALALATIRPERPAQAGETVRAILAIAETGDPGLLLDAVAAQIGIGAGSLEIVSEAGQELFVFALTALGFEPQDVTHVLLVCGAPLSRSVECLDSEQGGSRMHAGVHPAALVAFDHELGSRAVEVRRAVEPVDADEDCTRLGGAASSQNGLQPLDAALPDMGGDPEIARQTRHGRAVPRPAPARYSTEMPDSEARRFAVFGPRSPVTGRFLSRSKRSSADRVALPMRPSLVIGP